MKSVIIQLANSKEFGSKFVTNDVFWDELDEIIAVLQPGYDFTINMQKIGYGLSDFYIGWLRVKKNLERFVNGKFFKRFLWMSTVYLFIQIFRFSKQGETQFNLAANLLKAMDRRAPSLFQSPMFLCSVYLDPRIMFTLTPEQKMTAAMDLIKIHERIVEMSSKAFANHEGDDTLDEIQQEYQQNEQQSNSDRLVQVMTQYETEKACSIKESVMKFWQENGQKYELLRPLADIIHAVPSNQCCTERAFSSLSYIRNKYRMSLSSQNLSNVLMIRLNKDVFYSLCEEHIRKILDI